MPKTPIKLFRLILLIVSVLFVSCEINTSTNSPEMSFLPIDERIGSDGSRLQNPYSLYSMNCALDSLIAEGNPITVFQIVPTHLYVRFMPADSDEVALLYEDTSLVLFGYPLDYELPEGENYVDQDLEEDSTRWLYTRVPVDYVSPIHGYEVLDELFLPKLVNEDFPEEIQQMASGISDETWDLLETRSLQLTNNFTGEICDAGPQSNRIRSASSNRWHPRATIRVYDEILGRYIPLEGVKVRARHWFNWEEGITDSQGFAAMSGSFKTKVDWSIAWEGQFWDIRDGSTNQAYYRGPCNSAFDWNLDIGLGSKSYFFAHMHRACFNYWYRTYDIKSPYSNSTSHKRVKLCFINSSGRSYMKERLSGIGSLIKIYRYYENGAYRTCATLYETVIHELAHVSHWDIDNDDFAECDKRIVESWAVGVAYALAREYYGSSQLGHRDWQYYTFEMLMTPEMGKSYTPLVIDLMDTENQRSTRGDDCPVDNVYGYTLDEVEHSLYGITGWTQWRDNLYELYPNNPTRDSLTELFDNYIYWR